MASETLYVPERAAQSPGIALTGPINPAAGSGSWLTKEHPEFVKMKDRWKMTSDFYHADLIDESCAREYLIKRYQGEPDKAFQERLRLSDFTPHLGTLIDTLGGMLFSVEDRASRMWETEGGPAGLGDVADPKTPAHRLWHDADGKGIGWPTLWRQFALDIIVYQWMWVLVDTRGATPDAPHVVKLINPMRVPNWLDDGSEVLMLESQDLRSSLEDGSGRDKTWIRWRLDGWERLSKDSAGRAVREESGAYGYVNADGQPILPIFRIQLPLRRYVSWILAHKAKIIYNQESVRDYSLRTANFARLVLGVADEDQYDELIEKIKKGEMVLGEQKDSSGQHRYIAPSAEPVTAAGLVLDKKIEHFWISGFKMYEDAARERTATEVRQDVAGGVGAFLTLLKAAVDDAENGAFRLLEQAEFSATPSRWGGARVERSDDFASFDMAAVLDQMKKRYVGADDKPLPIGRSALVALAKESARFDGLPVDEDEIGVAVDAALLTQHMEVLNGLGIMPALLKARLMMKAVAALNIIDPKETIELADGEKKELLQLLQEKAEELALAQEEAEKRQAELPPFGGGGGQPPGQPSKRKEPPDEEEDEDEM